MEMKLIHSASRTSKTASWCLVKGLSAKDLLLCSLPPFIFAFYRNIRRKLGLYSGESMDTEARIWVRIWLCHSASNGAPLRTSVSSSMTWEAPFLQGAWEYQKRMAMKAFVKGISLWHFYMQAMAQSYTAAPTHCTAEPEADSECILLPSRQFLSPGHSILCLWEVSWVLYNTTSFVFFLRDQVFR